jgi:AcrR family transcriptional regulator
MSRIADPKAKSALLRAAEAVFAERGLAGAKVEDIAKQAGVSKGAFYLHFESKEAALERVVESFLTRCGSFFAPPSAYPGLPEDPAELVDFCFERDVAMFEFLWQNRAVLRIFPSCQGEYDYLVQAFRAEIDRTNREWLEHWRREGLYRLEVDSDLATTLISGAYNELTLRMLAAGERRPPLEEWLAFAQATFIRAYGTQELIGVLDARAKKMDVQIAVAAPRRGAPASNPERL